MDSHFRSNGLSDYLNAIVGDCHSCPQNCGRCEQCLNCLCPECTFRRDAVMASRIQLEKIAVSRTESNNEISTEGGITRMLFRYGPKGGSLKKYNKSPYVLYCQKEGKNQKWHRAPILRLWKGKTYIFEVIGDLPEGCGGLILTEKPEGGEGSILIPDTVVGKPGTPIVLTVGANTPDYFHYHDSVHSNTGYIIRVDKKIQTKER